VNRENRETNPDVQNMNLEDLAKKPIDEQELKQSDDTFLGGLYLNLIAVVLCLSLSTLSFIWIIPLPFAVFCWLGSAFYALEGYGCYLYYRQHEQEPDQSDRDKEVPRI